jgi:hypothetical protein
LPSPPQASAGKDVPAAASVVSVVSVFVSVPPARGGGVAVAVAKRVDAAATAAAAAARIVTVAATTLSVTAVVPIPPRIGFGVQGSGFRV